MMHPKTYAYGDSGYKVTLSSLSGRCSSRASPSPAPVCTVRIRAAPPRQILHQPEACLLVAQQRVRHLAEPLLHGSSPDHGQVMMITLR